GVDRGLGGFGCCWGLDKVLRGRREASRGCRVWLWGHRGRQFGRCACGFTPAFGRAVGPKARRVYGTAEAVPLRLLWFADRRRSFSVTSAHDDPTVRNRA